MRATFIAETGHPPFTPGQAAQDVDLSPMQQIARAEVHSAGCISSALNHLREFVAENRLKVGAAAAVLALVLSACESTEKRADMAPLPVPAATAASPQSPAITESPSVIKPEFKPGEQEELATYAGWDTEAISRMTVLERVYSIESELIVLGLDGFKPSESPIQELKAGINIAEIVAGRKPNLTAKALKLGPDTARDVNYQLVMSKSSSKDPDRRFVVFTAGQDQNSKVIPVNTPKGGHTKQTDKGITATILPDSPTVARDAFIEAFRMSTTAVIDPALRQSIETGQLNATNLRVANVAEPTPAQRLEVLRLLLEQREALSWADARESARAKDSYESFAAAAADRPVIAYANVGVKRYAAPSPGQFSALAFPAK